MLWGVAPVDVGFSLTFRLLPRQGQDAGRFDVSLHPISGPFLVLLLFL
jgi:hypothetical protein